MDNPKAHEIIFQRMSYNYGVLTNVSLYVLLYLFQRKNFVLDEGLLVETCYFCPIISDLIFRKDQLVIQNLVVIVYN